MTSTPYTGDMADQPTKPALGEPDELSAVDGPSEAALRQAAGIVARILVRLDREGGGATADP